MDEPTPYAIAGEEKTEADGRLLVQRADPVVSISARTVPSSDRHTETRMTRRRARRRRIRTSVSTTTAGSRRCRDRASSRTGSSRCARRPHGTATRLPGPPTRRSHRTGQALRSCQEAPGRVGLRHGPYGGPCRDLPRNRRWRRLALLPLSNAVAEREAPASFRRSVSPAAIRLEREASRTERARRHAAGRESDVTAAPRRSFGRSASSPSARE
jgi:hypothetical protein